MKISIITPTFNSEKTIADTIESIITQTHKDVEYIIIDGSSTDSTISIVNDFKKSFDIKVISEKDNGIYDAMNKGIRMATGDIVGILNSDDFYIDSDVLSKVVRAFENNTQVEGVYGDLVYCDREDVKKKKRFWKAGEYNEKLLDSGWIIPHPAFFVRNTVYQKLDYLFNTALPIAADYELLLRLLKIIKIKVVYIPEILVIMREGGNSGSNLKQRTKGWHELKESWLINNLKIPPFFIVRRVLQKLSQLC